MSCLVLCFLYRLSVAQGWIWISLFPSLQALVGGLKKRQSHYEWWYFFLMTTCNLLQQSSCDVTFWSVASLKKMVFSSYSWHISIIAAMFVKMKHHYCLCYSYSNQAETGVLKEVCDTYIEGVWRATVQWVNVFKFSKTLKLASHLLLHLWVSALTPEVFLSHQVHSPESRFVQ